MAFDLDGRSAGTSSSSVGGGPEWELRKENAAPLARGRNVSTLSRALSTPLATGGVDDDTRKTNERRVRQFERLVRPSERAAEMVAEREADGDVFGPGFNPMDLLEAEGDTNDEAYDDPLVHWLSYIKFHQEAYPSDTRAQFLLMERCTRTLVTFPRYRSDVRFVRVCVLYADRTSSPSGIFKFLHQKGVGGKTSLFWIAWAWVAEKTNDFQFAEKVFLKGLRKKAKPTRMLEQRHKQFQRRMSRHWLNNTELSEASIDGGGRDGAVEDDDGSSRREALSGLTEGGLRRNHRSRRANHNSLSFSSGMQNGTTNNAGRGHPNISNPSTFRDRRAATSRGGGGFGSRGASSSSRNKNSNNGAKTKGGFSIFVDENNENDGGGYNLDRDRDGGGGKGGRIATESDRVKENSGRTERWNERGGIGRDDEDGANDDDSGGTRRTAATGPAFAVFVDEDCAAKNEREEEEIRREQERKKREDDGRSLRQRMDGGVADRLARDPLRYMRNPSKQSLDRAKYGDGVASSAKKSARRRGENSAYDESLPIGKDGAHSQKSGSSKLPCGFDKSLLSKDNSGQERCFEEARAKGRYYKLAPAEDNFNLLAKATLSTQDDSAMDVEDSSLNDVDMEDNDESTEDASDRAPQSILKRSELSASTIHGSSGPDSSSKAPMPKRVLFGMNTSISSQNKSHNLSTASSTVNERDAVGGKMQKEEETINTRIAMKELSMMFSSPAVDSEAGDKSISSSAKPSTSGPLFSVQNGKPSANLTPASGLDANKASADEDNGDTATFSIMADLIEDGDHGTSTSILAAPEGDLNDNVAAIDYDGVGDISSAVDADALVPASLSFGRGGALSGGGGFQIFCDEENDTGSSLAVDDTKKNPVSATAPCAPFSIFQNPGANGDDDGDTATFSDIGDTFKGLVESESAQKKPSVGFAIFEDDGDGGAKKRVSRSIRSRRRQSAAIPRTSVLAEVEVQNEDAGFSIFCDAENDDASVSPREHILTEQEGFGVDISRIAPASPDATLHDALSREKVVEYSKIHTEDVNKALKDIFRFRSPCIVDYRSQRTPRPLLQKVPMRGAEVDIGDATAVVRHELGRGAYGVVLLCDSKDDGQSFSREEQQSVIALKVQAPTGCLAWEYHILQAIEDRVPPPQAVGAKRQRTRRRRRSSGSLGGDGDDSLPLPFPRAFSFVAFADGGLLGMTAGSNSGLNLVDLVNSYRVNGGGPVPELIVLHYTARMLKHVESLHSHGKILHCDIKPDNFVLVSSSSACGTGSEVVQGADLMLVDFGRAIDLSAVAEAKSDPLDVRLCGNAAAKGMECVAMREGYSWGVDADTYGLCASVYSLLYGVHMDVEKDAISKRWRPRKPLRRYWKKELWSELFDTLLNVDGTKNGSHGSHPNSLRVIRRSFEGYLDGGSRRKELESLLKHQAGLVPKKKRDQK